MNLSEDLISNLPFDIKFYIYKNFMEPYIYLQMYKESIEQIESKQLCIIKLRPLLPIMLKNEIIINNLRKNFWEFDTVYLEHKILNKRNFKLIKKGDIFCLAILYYLYH